MEHKKRYISKWHYPHHKNMSPKHNISLDKHNIENSNIF